MYEVSKGTKKDELTIIRTLLFVQYFVCILLSFEREFIRDDDRNF